MTKPLTVIMSTFNETKYELEKSIDSILNQTFSNFIFIIIDDNPSSKSLKDYLLLKKSSDNRIHLIFHKRNEGLVKSLNDGLKYANTPLIARMDADDISNKNRFLYQIKFMKKYHLDFTFINYRDIINGLKMDYYDEFNFKIVNQKLLKYIFSYYSNIAIHPGWLVRKKVFDTLHGYRQVPAAEDFDFIIRAISYGFRLGYQPNCLFIRRVRKNGISKNSHFKQFISSEIIRQYSRKYNYNKIIPLSLIYKIQNNIITSDNLHEFKMFINQGHSVKYHFNLNNLLKFILILIKFRISRQFLKNVIMNPIRKRKIIKIANNRLNN